VGSLGCGKSSLVSKYAPNSTDECSTVVRTYGSRSITVKLYEIPEPTHATSKHYTDSDAIIYLYGNDNRESFQQIEELIDATLN
jgi:GTPase SAR1 family protein